MPLSECTECGRLVYGSDDSEGYCPDCAGEWDSHVDHDQQAQDLLAQESRHHVIANDRGMGR